MKRLLACVFLSLCVASLTAATANAQADCQFVLGFKTLRDLIGHGIVGVCLENEHYNAIGDSVQQTSGGLLAWRKADNWTAFTDGYRTWINGPNGLVQRLNTERFEWEADYADFSPRTQTAALTRDALRNAEYAAEFPTYGTLQRDRIGAQDPLAFGDLNGDGTDDAAVVLLLVDGNAGHRYLAAVLNENGVPRHVASVFLGLNIGIDSVEIANGVVTLETKQLGPNDPTCCPTKEVTAAFILIQETWQLLGEMPSGQITAASPTLDPTLEHALHTLRTTWKPTGERMYQLFLGTGASAQFGPIAGASQWHSSPNRIIINEHYRNESPEVLAHTLIWPTVALAFYTESGTPDSWEACIERVVAQHIAQAQWWLSKWGESGKQSPTPLEQGANNNLAYYLNEQLHSWVRGGEHYRQFCAQFGEPTSALPSAQSHRDTLLAVLPHELAKELGLKEGTAAFSAMKGMLRNSVELGLWLYEGQFVLGNPRLGNADPRLAIGDSVERERFIRYWLNNPGAMRRTAQEVRARLYSALSGRATGNIQDTGNDWLNRLLRSDPDGFVYWVTTLEEAISRSLNALYPSVRQSILEDQIRIFLYYNAEDPDRTTGPTMLPRGWLE